MKSFSLFYFFILCSFMAFGEEKISGGDSTRFVGETIEVVYLPKKGVDVFSVVKTDKAYYEIRTGAYRKLDCFEYGKYNESESPKKGISVKTIWTDSEDVFIELMDSSFIVIGYLEISGDGVFTEAVHYYNAEDINEEDFDFENDEDMIKLSSIDE